MDGSAEPGPPIVHVWAELGEAGARRGVERGDVVVIMDILRASTTAIAALQAGASQVLPVLTIEEALARRGDPACRIAGERGGARVDGFHYGNSPTEIWARRDEIAGRTLVLTTSNGTRCFQAALGTADGETRFAAHPMDGETTDRRFARFVVHPAVLIGAAVNADAVARAALDLARARVCDVTLVAVGIGEQPTEEDTFGQGLVGARLVKRGAVPQTTWPVVNEADILDVFLHARPALRLIGLGYEQDIRFCAQIDLWDAVPIYQEGGFQIHGSQVVCESGKR